MLSKIELSYLNQPMKNFFASIALLVVATAASATAPVIPSQFQGTWGSVADCKTDSAGGESDGITEINSAALNQYETGCDLVSGRSTGSSEYTGTFRCNVEGNVSVSRVRLRLESNKLRVDSSAPLSRCK